MRQLIINRLHLGFVAFLVCVSAPALAQSDIRLERLNLIFEGNLSGAVYVTHCDTKPLTSYPIYVENAKLTTEALASELMKKDSRITQAQVAETLRARQNQITSTLGAFYQQNGCSTQQAAAAKKHFDTFNRKPRPDMVQFLATIENQQ